MNKKKIYNVIFDTKESIGTYIKKHGKAMYLRVIHQRLNEYADYRNNKKNNSGTNRQEMS